MGWHRWATGQSVWLEAATDGTRIMADTTGDATADFPL